MADSVQHIRKVFDEIAQQSQAEAKALETQIKASKLRLEELADLEGKARAKWQSVQTQLAEAQEHLEAAENEAKAIVNAAVSDAMKIRDDASKDADRVAKQVREIAQQLKAVVGV